jgi:anaerobic magnesium-protoporphyrin IX monomethyl ester cyclase
VRPRHAPHYSAIMAAALRRAGHEVAFVDQALHSLDLADMVRRTQLARPDLLLLMRSEYNRLVSDDALRAALEALQQGLPGVPVLGYGRLSEAAARATLERAPALAGVLWDEPEFAAVAAAAALANADGAAGRSLDCWRGVPGLSLRDEKAQRRVRPPDLDDPPTPDWDVVDIRAYAFSPHQQAADLVFPVLASRGCPFPCFYCEVRATPPYRARSADSVVAEIQELHRRWGAKTVFLADPTFAVHRESALEFCRRMETERPSGLRWSCMSRTDRVDPELLRAMARAGCFNVLYGIESLNPEALRQAKKQLDPATVEPAIRGARDAGIEVIASIMIGLPGDSPEGFDRTLKSLIRMEPDYAQFFVVQVPAELAPEGSSVFSGWDEGRFEFPGHVVAPPSFGSREQLEALRRNAWRRFYLRPRYVARRASKVLRSGNARAELLRAARGGVLALKMAAGRSAEA